MAAIRDRVVIIGGTSGIGLATARRLAQAGAEIIVSGRDEAKLQRAVKEIDGNATGRAIDASDPARLKAFFSGIAPIDHVVLTLSGGEGAGPLKELDLATLRAGFEAKFWAHVAAAQAALPHLKSSGSITFVTAASAGGHLPGTSGLAAINGALNAMVPVLAVELKPLRVNAISPGAIDTPWWDKWPAEQKAALFNQIAATSPVGRVGKAEDVADAIAFVVRNGFVTGQVIQCDGGIQLS
ncbi:MAG TPA: SDR family oxidoreductase [Dongiaceae bacterium]|jgi:NAD(P)-dependent dehydrogenase (short-subunit alcohol dehydrogenase family)|nr:SDR family oxidoreductase [Dongiaceae bacterium]